MSLDRSADRLPDFDFLMDQGAMVVRAGTVVLYAPHGGSFDARYYGPIPLAGVQTVVRPIWTVADAPRTPPRLVGDAGRVPPTSFVTAWSTAHATGREGAARLAAGGAGRRTGGV